MKRADMLHCAGVTAERFKVLKARKQVPFASLEEDGSLRGGNYTLDQAFQLRLALDLIGDDATGGIGPDNATIAVQKAMEQFPRHPLHQFEPLDWWAGVVVFSHEYADNSRLYWPIYYAGEIGVLPAWIDEKSRFGPDHDPSPIELHARTVRVLIANATSAADFVRDRAQAIGIPEGSFDHPVTTAAQADA